MTSKTQQESSHSQRWWGTFDIPERAWCAWDLGVMQFYLYQNHREWAFSWHETPSPSSFSFHVDLDCPPPVDRDNSNQARFVHASSEKNFELKLALADRSVIARPESLVYVPPNQTATLFVSSGLWLQPTLNSHRLMDIPIFRPSDTWFGENTREGELCYFSRTRARTENMATNESPHRAVTPITVVNKTLETLKIERIRVPVPYLNLYSKGKGEFFTNSLSMVLEQNEKEATMEIVSLGNELHDAELVSLAREKSDRGLVNQTIAKFLG